MSVLYVYTWPTSLSTLVDMLADDGELDRDVSVVLVGSFLDELISNRFLNPDRIIDYHAFDISHIVANNLASEKTHDGERRFNKLQESIEKTLKHILKVLSKDVRKLVKSSVLVSNPSEFAGAYTYVTLVKDTIVVLVGMTL